MERGEEWGEGTEREGSWLVEPPLHLTQTPNSETEAQGTSKEQAAQPQTLNTQDTVELFRKPSV